MLNPVGLVLVVRVVAITTIIALIARRWLVPRHGSRTTTGDDKREVVLEGREARGQSGTWREEAGAALGD